MNYPFCPNCGSENTLVKKQKTESLDIKGETIEVSSTVTACSNCDGEFSFLDETFDVIEAARAVYRERHDIPSPAEIKSFMNEYKFSLRDMEKLTGIAFKTIDRYLKGAIPDPSNVVLLKIFMNYPQVLLCFMNNVKDFNAKRFGAVKSKLKQKIENAHSEKCRNCAHLANSIPHIMQTEI